MSTEEVFTASYLCGTSLEGPSCNKPCPTGQDKECIADFGETHNKCFYTTGCFSSSDDDDEGGEENALRPAEEEEPPSMENNNMNTDEVMANYHCGTSFEDARTNCHKPCPTGHDRECFSGLFDETYKCFLHWLPKERIR